MDVLSKVCHVTRPIYFRKERRNAKELSGVRECIRVRPSALLDAIPRNVKSH